MSEKCSQVLQMSQLLQLLLNQLLPYSLIFPLMHMHKRQTLAREIPRSSVPYWHDSADAVENLRDTLNPRQLDKNTQYTSYQSTVNSASSRVCAQKRPTVLHWHNSDNSGEHLRDTKPAATWRTFSPHLQPIDCEFHNARGLCDKRITRSSKCATQFLSCLNTIFAMLNQQVLFRH